MLNGMWYVIGIGGTDEKQKHSYFIYGPVRSLAIYGRHVLIYHSMIHVHQNNCKNI